VEDVQIGDYRRPWNARRDAGKLAKGIPQASYWATDPNGLEQIGCIYTAQGFEFDYVGVIIGPDLAYDLAEKRWVGRKEASRDSAVTRGSGDSFTLFVKNAYRVLLTRGMKGCFVYACDPGTAKFLAIRLASGQPS